MNNRLRLFLVVLALLCLGNLGWRMFANRGRITVNASDRPLSEVVRSIEKQGGIRLRSNLPAETKVTLHLRKVPLLHALDVLAANTETSWNVSYFAAPDEQSIDRALATFAAAQELEGWKRFALPPMRGFGGFEEGSADPRAEEWKPKPATPPALHTYLEQASQSLNVQFWVPAEWNPSVSRTPREGRVGEVVAKLAKAAGGKSREIFVLRGRPQRALAELGGLADFANAPERRERGSGERGAPSEEMRRVMEERIRAQIERLPKDKKAEALARFEEGRKFFEQMSALSPEERRARMEERMEQAMSNSDAMARMSAEGTKRAAMKSADQRSDGYRAYLDRKRSN